MQNTSETKLTDNKKDPGFARSVVAIALPIALQNLITFAVNLADTVMIGLAPDGETLLSAVSLANQPFFVLMMITFGMSGAATVLASQYWGRQDMKSVRTIFATILRIAMLLAGIFEALVLIFPEFVLSLYSTDPRIISAGVEYLRILGWAYLLFGFSNTLICCIRSVEMVRFSVLVNLLSFVTNVFLNWILIFGNLGAPALGVKGAAIATLAARTLEFVVTLVFVFFIDTRLGMRFHDLLLHNKVLSRDLLRHGLPVFINESCWSLAVTLQSAILGHITYSEGDPVAANTIANTMQQLAMIVVFGIANAATVLVGKATGAGQLDRARHRANVFAVMSFVVGIFGAGIVFSLRHVAVNFYNISEASKALATQMMTVTAAVTFFAALSAMYIVGIFRGAGDTVFCLVTEMGALWGIAIPLALLASRVWMLAPPLVLALMKIDEPIKVVISLFRHKSGKYLKVLTRDFSAT